MDSLFKHPSAWIPLALSCAMYAVAALRFMGVIPPGPDGDEGAAAHLFQLWLLLEAFLIPYFAVTSLPHNRKWALKILALQIALILPMVMTIFYLEL